jgi:hypothetical protein
MELLYVNEFVPAVIAHLHETLVESGEFALELRYDGGAVVGVCLTAMPPRLRRMPWWTLRVDVHFGEGTGVVVGDVELDLLNPTSLETMVHIFRDKVAGWRIAHYRRD